MGGVLSGFWFLLFLFGLGLGLGLPGWAGLLRLGWAGLGWAGLGWAGLGWAGLGVGWAGLRGLAGKGKDGLQEGTGVYIGFRSGV